MTKEDRPRPKVLIWDIEASDLAADFGFVFCIGWKWLGLPEINLIKIRQFPRFKRDVTDDRDVIKAFAAVMGRADLIVAHYGDKYDIPFVNTRSLIHGMGPMPNVPSYDPWRTARYKLKFNSNRLDNISKHVPILKGEERPLKTPIEPRCWVRAKAGHVPSLRYIEEHCRADVIVLEKEYLAIRPFASSLPNLAKCGGLKEEGCPSCGSPTIQSRGYRLTARGNHRRYQCRLCRHWFALPIKIKV